MAQSEGMYFLKRAPRAAQNVVRGRMRPAGRSLPTPGQNYSCSFVAGKSRVAPSPKQTIPRLELCAAVTAVRLAKTVKNEYDFKLDRVFFWSDSTTVLSYINNTSKRRPAFETNRIDLIRRHSKASQWRWVDTSSNPADPFSRGLSPKLVEKA